MIKICAYDKCRKEFVPTNHNMKYCSNECCRDATNERIMRQYYERKANKINRNETVRICDTKGCGTVLSRYNDSKICQKCEALDLAKERAGLRRMLG